MQQRANSRQATFSCHHFNRPPRAFSLRGGVSVVEVLVVLGLLLVVAAIMFPQVQRWRESSRAQSCRNNFRQWVLSLQQYHDTHQSFPPAAIWSVDRTASVALHESRRIERITEENWAILLLPYSGEQRRLPDYETGKPIGSEENRSLRTTTLRSMSCPSDTYHRAANAYLFPSEDSATAPVQFARGNYAINGGSHNPQVEFPDTTFARGEFTQLELSEQPRAFAMWGTGIAGINRAFSRADIANAQSAMIVFDELRSGLSPQDPRGVWALGQIGGSITWGHGIAGDAGQPNHPWPRSDDILGCDELHRTLGGDLLLREGMPCVYYIDKNQQVAARSLHPGGVHAAFLDGSVRFLSNAIDPGLWHVLHSRETPADLFAADELEHLFTSRACHEEATTTVPPTASGLRDFATATATVESRRPTRPIHLPAVGSLREATHAAGAVFPSGQAAVPAQPGTADQQMMMANSLGMQFVEIPAGAFTMGLPDVGHRVDLPELVGRRVEITRAYLLGKHEVTWENWQRVFTQQRPLEQQQASSGWERLAAQDPADFPARGMTWNEAVAFCEQLSRLPEEVSAGHHYRLPTEAEWEYACRSGLSEAYHGRVQRLLGERTGEAAGMLPALPLTAVGDYLPNEFGLHDMRGNVWEWTADWFDREYPLRSPLQDPRGPARGYLKVVRGSDWRYVGEPCHIDYAMLSPWKSNPLVGLRVVLERTASSAHSPQNSLPPESTTP